MDLENVNDIERGGEAQWWRFGLVALFVISAAMIQRVHFDHVYAAIDVPYVEIHYPSFAEKSADYNWWEYFLPMSDLKGIWATTGFVLNYFLEKSLGAANAHLLLLGTAILLVGMAALRWFERVDVAAILMAGFAFCPLNLSAYLWWGSNNIYNIVIFASVVLLVLRQVHKGGDTRFDRVALILSLWALAVSYEIWLNFAVPVFLIWILWEWCSRKDSGGARSHVKNSVKTMRVFGFSFFLVAGVYLALRVWSLSELMRGGSEATSLMGKGAAFASDDLVHNLFFFPYMAVSQFLVLDNGGSFGVFSSGGVVSTETLTQGYLSNREQWPDIDWVMRANYLSQWKFQAGILMALMVGVFVFGVRRIRGGGTNRDWWVVVTGLVGGVILASPTHSILSVVHFNVWPHYPYKAATAVFLLLVLIGMCLQRFLVARNISSRTSVLIFFTSFIYFVANYWACSYKQNSFLRFVWGEDGFFLKGFLPPTDLFF